ncbi:DUF1587 domain-containing protein, partial [Prosthecobacter sp.]|uniref:DUF1587 domain-containing protein n=1 Tax=Prosthecobacter sp. TaxID=1965333 RepID=UPI0026187E59
MPPRTLRHDLRVMRLVSCALLALLPALSTHAQSPVPGTPVPAAKASPAAKADASRTTKPAAAQAPSSAPAPTQAAIPSAASPAKATTSPAPHSIAPHSLAKNTPAAAPKAPAKPIAKTPTAKPPVATALTVQDEVRRTFKDKIVPFVKTYCYECHGDRRMKGGVTFHPALRNPSDPAYIRRWKMGLATVHAHDMPPDDADAQPPDAEREAFMAWVGRLKYLSPKDPGAFVIRRLTKTEYGNTLHDLLGVDPSLVKELPDEVPGEGYMNTLSPLQMEQYLSIANEAVSRAFSRS